MTLLNPALLAGLLLAVIPVLLHLMLRAKPKRLVFPALRLIQQRRLQNVRRMNLRHLWLLLLRIGVIALIVLAVCRPSLPAANYSLSVLEWVTLLTIAILGVAAYLGIMAWWRRQQVSRTALLTRRTMLRGAIGVTAILLSLVSVAWPYARRVSAEIRDPAPRSAENIPFAAVFLVDTSASMAYRQANKTRLQAAQELAKKHLGRLPSGSKVAVASSSESMPAAFSSDLVAAQSRIDSLEIKAVSLSLNDRLRQLLQSQEDDRKRVTSEQSSVPVDHRQDRFIRGIYIFTDLAKSAWRDDASMSLRDELQRLRWLGIYLIDVGEQDPINVSLKELSLSREAVPARASIRIDAIVSSIGAVKPDQTVELSLKQGDQAPSHKGTQTVQLQSGSEARVSFYPVDIPLQPYTHGEIRLTGSDPLSVDDVLYFTVHTIPSLKVLVVAERPEISQYWMLALNTLSEGGLSAFQLESAITEQLEQISLPRFDVVCLINASQPTEIMWKQLHAFVEGGGGLAVFSGANSSLAGDSTGVVNFERINPLKYQTEAAMAVLPGKLEASLRFTPARTMDLRKSQHVLLKRFDELGALTELGITDIRRYWKVEPVADAAVIARYSTTSENDPSGPPALLERRIGQGRVLMMTTGVDGISWNDLLQDPGWYLVFVDQVTQYLAWQSTGKFNHLVGDEVVLPLDRDHKLAKAILRMPDFKQRSIEIPEKSRTLTLRDSSLVGSYSVDSADRAINYHQGFSLNLPAAECDLKRLEKPELDSLLGEHYSIARDLDKLEQNILTDRLGQEMYGMVLAILIAVFALEQFTATWFYRTDE